MTAFSAVLVLVIVALSVSAPAVSAAPVQHDILGFGDTLEPTITAGANQVIRATGTISNTTLCALGGTNDFLFPAADVYLVKAGSVSSGGSLKEAGGGAPATIISASAGGYLDEIVGITSPGGTLGEGSYDVVVDECQDGRFDPGVDSIFPKAVTVRFPPKIPPYTGYIDDIKAKAAKAGLQWLYASIALDAVRGELGLGDLSNVETDNPDTSTIRQILDKVIGWIAIVKNPFSQLLSGGPWDVIGSGVNAAVNEVKHYDAIAADPPDADFKHPVTVPKITTTAPTSPDAPVAAVEAMAAPAQVENAVSAAFLTALERYQGARVAGDAGWALIHAREVASLARLLAAAQTRSATAAIAMSSALGALPGFTALHQETHDIGARIQTQGFTGDEIQALRNLGYSTADIEQLRAALPPQMMCNGCWYSSPSGVPPYPNTTAGLQAALNDLATAETAAATSSTALASRVDGVITALSAQSSVPRTAPAADAGGPYSATAGTPITLDSSKSVAGQGETISSIAWDTDGDGAFDDATGATPSVTLGPGSPGLVGVKVTGSDGQSAIAYAPVTVTSPAAPSISSHSPAARSVTVTVGRDTSFSLVTQGGMVAWSLDGTAIPGATGDSYSLTATAGQIGPHVLAATLAAPDGQQATITWTVSVVGVDADGDGWTASSDCDDHDALVNPGRHEVIGNGIDDDCDPATSDTPLADYTGQAMSWGTDQTAVLGRGVGTGTEADKPSNITGMGSVAQLAAGADLGVAVDTDGAVWSWGTGSGNSWNDPAPVAVPDPSGTGQLGVTGPKATAVTSNRQSAALLADGTVAAWGDNTNDALGIGSGATTVATPGYVQAGGTRLSGVTEIAAGGSFLGLATKDGSLYVTGGVCGTPTGTVAEPVAGLPGKVIKIAAGTGHLLILLDDGNLYGCGANGHGQLGAGPSTIGAPQRITLPSGMARPAQLAAGDGFSLVLDTDGTVWAFGRGDHGQFGDGATTDTSTPTKVAIPDGAVITQLTAGCASPTSRWTPPAPPATPSPPAPTPSSAGAASTPTLVAPARPVAPRAC
jgi:hypothetical protein